MKKLLVSIAALSLLLAAALAYAATAYGQQPVAEALESAIPAGIVVAVATAAAVLISARVENGETEN